MGKTANKTMVWDCMHSAALRQPSTRCYASSPKSSIFNTFNQEIICLFGEAVCAVK